MNGLLRHSPSIYKGLSELGVPFKSDLDTWHKGITDNDFAEKINNLPAKILPRVASFVAGNLDEVDTGIDLSNATDVDMTMICYRGASGIITACEAIGTSTSRCGILWFTDNMIYCITMNGSSSQNGSILYNNTGWFTLRMVYNGGGLADADKLKLYINGNLQTLSYAATIPSSLGVIANTFTIGHALNGYTAGLISYVSVSKDGATASQYYPTGQGDYEYDVSGNNNHGTWSGTGSRYDFDLNGSRYANDNGYSLWQKAANPNIQVSFDINGDALSLTPGVNIETGYTKTRDIVAGGSKWNIADCLVDTEHGSLLQNDTAGIAYRTNTVAYGLVFDGILNKNAELDKIHIKFIGSLADGSASDGYAISILANERLALQSGVTIAGAGFIMYSDIDYITLNTDYRVLIWRNETTNQYVTGAIGTFAVYIQGKSKLVTNKTYIVPNTDEMELVDTSGGIGTNPITDNTYTTSAYIVTDLDAGDQISKISINGEYISPYDFTVSTGAYSIIDNADNAIFNRTNATRQTATSRASIYYDSSYPFRYQINEIADPRIYDTFFETAYKNRAFGKVVLSGSDLILYSEQLNYGDKKTGSDLDMILRYCKITDIYP